MVCDIVLYTRSLDGLLLRNTWRAQKTSSVKLVTGGGTRAARLVQSVGYSLRSNLQVISFILSPYAFYHIKCAMYW